MPNQKSKTKLQKDITGKILLFGFWYLIFALPLSAEVPILSSSSASLSSSSSLTSPVSTTPPIDNGVNMFLESLNKIPEDQLLEKSGMAATLMDQLRSTDAPDYQKLRALVGRADVRKSLNPGVKFMIAGVLAPRWDGFNIAGNLYLAALMSTNSEIRSRARQKLVGFIQPAHIPVLINVLNTPGPNVLAFEVLQEVTGQSLDPTPKVWLAWWAKNHDTVDLVGRQLNQSRLRLTQAQLHTFDQTMLWYLPEGVTHANGPVDQRPMAEQTTIGQWNQWVNTDVKNYLADWETYKPFFEHIIHQPDPRVGAYLVTLTSDPGFGDYASVVLAWRGQKGADISIKQAYVQWPTVGRALAMGALGNKDALEYLLITVASHKDPLTYGIMDVNSRGHAAKLPALGLIPAELAFELLTQQTFGLVSVDTRSEKKKALKKAQSWLKTNYASLTLDPSSGRYVTPHKK